MAFKRLRDLGMHDYFIVMGEDYDRIVRSDGAVRTYKLGFLLPLFKAAKIKLVKTGDGEFEIQLRDRPERHFVNTYLSGWPKTFEGKPNEDEWKRYSELKDTLHTQLGLSPEDVQQIKREAQQAKLDARQAEIDAEATKIRELISDPNYRFQTITNDASA